jgi:putative flippase GtrA
MGPRLRRLGGEAARFSAVNVVATVVAVVLFNVLVHGVPGLWSPGVLNGYPVTSWFAANCVGMAISFDGSRRFAFKNRRPSGPGGGALNYAIVNLVSFLIPMSCLWITRNAFGWDSAVADNVSSNVVGAALGMLARFWAFRRYVFKRARPAALPAVLPAAAGRSARGPEVGPDEAELVEHQPQQRQADPHDVVRVAGDARDERSTEPVEREGACHR